MKIAITVIDARHVIIDSEHGEANAEMAMDGRWWFVVDADRTTLVPDRLVKHIGEAVAKEF